MRKRKTAKRKKTKRTPIGCARNWKSETEEEQARKQSQVRSSSIWKKKKGRGEKERERGREDKMPASLEAMRRLTTSPAGRRGECLRSSAHSHSHSRRTTTTSTGKSKGKGNKKGGPESKAAVQGKVVSSPRVTHRRNDAAVSEKMRRLKQKALAVWQSVDEEEALHATEKAEKKRAKKKAERELQQKVLLEARCEFMEEKIVAQNEYIRELSSALAVAKSALASAMSCLETPIESEDILTTKLPDLSRYIPDDQARQKGEEESCDAESFSRIETALWQADVLLESSIGVGGENKTSSPKEEEKETSFVSRRE